MELSIYSKCHLKFDIPAVGHFASLGTYVHSKNLVPGFLHLSSYLCSWGTKVTDLLRVDVIRPCGRGSAEGFERLSNRKCCIFQQYLQCSPRPFSLPRYAAHTDPGLGVMFHNMSQNVDIVAFDYSLSSITGSVVDTRYAAHRQL